jgi:hypothetical protein
MANEPDLRQGATDAETNGWVTYLQQLLGHLYTGAVDGIFGPITDRAVREYQQQHQLVVDGWVGPITWGSLTGQQGDGGDGSAGQDGVPQDLVAAGAPANFSQWTEEQKAEFFKYAPKEGTAQGESDEVTVAEIPTDSEEEGRTA